MDGIKWVWNHMPKTEDKYLGLMRLEEVQKVRNFHESFPQYHATPLVGLERMADHLGLGRIYVKDESGRFGLNAFKVLGSSYAMACCIAKQTGRDVSELPYQVLTSGALREEFGQATFFTATDGNHGRGVAWAAEKLGQKSVVLMPKGTTRARLDNILAEGAKASIEDCNYDDCVRRAAALAKESGSGVLMQDTAWEGYEQVPSWIMQGYGTMIAEADEQLRAQEGAGPTHVFIQAGVGSLAGAVQGYFVNRYPEAPPKVVVVEALAAACLYEGARKGDGSVQTVGGDMKTIMAGLACGEPNPIAWDILKNHADAFVAVPDEAAAKAMRMLAAPIRGDSPITSGESGASAFGALVCIMRGEEYRGLREHLELGSKSRVLLFSTEGNTDPQRYRSIVWDGNTDGN